MLHDASVPAGHITTPLMRLQDPSFTRVVLVTLAETTPVAEAPETAPTEAPTAPTEAPTAETDATPPAEGSETT